MEDKSAGDSPRSSEISASCWNFGDKKEDLIHRIHSYPARFPSFIATKALRYAERQGVNVRVMADVFCGCGTTAVEAKRNGIDFWGCDINPVAALIAQVKTHHYRDAVLARYFAAIKEEFRRKKPTPEEHARISGRLRYWFPKRNIEDLIRLDYAIRFRTPLYSPHQKFFLCAFSNILKPTSRWLTKSIKAQLDPHKSPRSVMEAFEAQFALMRRANLRNHFPATHAQIRIRTQNFLTSADPGWRPDLIVTSPPYVTSYDYAEIHQLSTLWLRYVSDYRALRKNMLGNRYGVKPLKRSTITALGPIAEDTYLGLVSKDKRRAHSIARYFLDMNKAVEKCGRLLNDRGMAVFVIGNTQYKDVKINNATYLADCMRRAKFSGIEMIPRKVSSKTMTPYRDAQGRFTQDSTQRKVYGEEFVVIGGKR